eukprot:1023199_1
MCLNDGHNNAASWCTNSKLSMIFAAILHLISCRNAFVSCKSPGTSCMYHGRIRTIITFHQRRETSQAFCPMHRIKVINMRSNAFTLFDALSAHIAVSSDIIIFTTPNTLNNASKLRLP